MRTSMLFGCVILLASGLAHSCDILENCTESSDKDWHDGIFCYSNFDKSGLFLNMNCSWLPYGLSSFSKMQLAWWGDDDDDSDCKEFYANETSYTITNGEMTGIIYKIWVSLQLFNECVKTKNFTIMPNAVCQAPTIKYAAQSANFLRFQLNSIGQLRYKEIETGLQSTVNVTGDNTAVDIPLRGTPKSFVFQLRCLSESCFHCKWTQEKSIPHELTGSPNVTVLVEKSSPGKQNISIAWKYVMHAYVDVYIVIIQRVPNNCKNDIISRTNSTNLMVSLSIAYFNVSVIATNEAGNSSIATHLVHPLPSPELPGKIFATYEHGTILLTWNPLLSNDFWVISWGTNYTQMKSKIIMENIKNFSIEGPFEGLKRYTIMIHLYDLNMCMESTNEKTFGITYIFVEEGVPRIGSPNVTVKNITKTSAVIEWEEIPEEECLGFLLFYKISCTDFVWNITREITVDSSSKRSYLIEDLTSNREYHVRVSGGTIKGEGPPSANLIFTTLHYAEGEFQIIIISICVGLMLIAVIAVSVCAYILRRTKNWYFPKIPNPMYSYIGKINEEPPIQIKLAQLLPTQEEVSCKNIIVEVIEKVPFLDTPIESCAQDMEINMYSDYQNQWCPTGQASLTQDETTNLVQQTADHINDDNLEAI